MLIYYYIICIYMYITLSLSVKLIVVRPLGVQLETTEDFSVFVSVNEFYFEKLWL